MKKKNTRKNKLLFTAAVAGASFLNYSRNAYAAYSGCYNISGTSYLCDSAATDTQDFTGKDSAVISTAEGFSVNTSSGSGIIITGDGNLVFTDVNASSITTTDSEAAGLFMESYSGSISISADSNISSAGHGIQTYNNGTGATSIIFDGIIAASGAYRGINASNAASATDITIETGAGSSIDADDVGIYAHNYGSGDTLITVNGDVNSENGRAVHASNNGESGNVIITTGAESSLTGYYYGIASYNYGTGNIEININGDVSGNVLAKNSSSAAGISITTGADSSIDNTIVPVNEIPDDAAIYAGNTSTTGDTNITINGDIHAVDSSAIMAANMYTDTNIIINGGSGGTIVESTTDPAITSHSDTSLNITLNGIYSAVTISGYDIAISFQDENDNLEINGNVNINGDVTGGGGTDTLSIGTATINMGTSSGFSGFEAVNITGELTLLSGKTLEIGSSTAINVDGGSLKVTVKTEEDYSKLIGSSGITFGEGGAITVDASSISAIASGTTLTGVFSGGTVTGIESGLLSDNSLTYKFTSVVNDDSIDILVETNSALSSSSPNASSVASTLDTIINAGGGGESLQEIVNTINSLESGSKQAEAIKTLAPNVSGANSTAAISVSEVAIGTIENHMQTASSNMYSTGFATGNEGHSGGFWGQVFGKDITQGFRSGIEGYDANVEGFTIGADTFVEGGVTAGGAISYAGTSVKNSNTHTDINSTQATIYGTYDLGKLYYESLGAASLNHFRAARKLFDNSVAHSDYDSYQFFAKFGTGYHINLSDAVNITPFASLQYSYVMLPDYTENGSSAPLNVESDDLEVLKSGLGAKAQYDIKEKGLTYRPYISAGWYYDFINDTLSTTSNFVTAPDANFISNGATPNRNSYNLGTGLDLLAQDILTVSFDYDYEIRQSFRAHTGKAKVRIEF